MHGFVIDCRVVARGLWKARGFAAVVIVTLALGTGAATAMFSVLRASLLRPPPFPEPERIVMLSLTEQTPGGGRPLRRGGWTYVEYEFLRDNATSFESIAAHTGPHFNLSGYDQAERVQGEVVSANYFRVLGVSAAAGRGFVAVEDSVPGAVPVVMISHALWQSRFGSDPALVGKRVSVNRVPLGVVGIMPSGFHGLSGRAELWIPQAMAPILGYSGRLPYSQSVVARLRRGRTFAQAQSEVQLLGRRLAAAFPDSTASAVQRDATLTPLSQARIDVSNRRPVLILFGAVGVLLLIACANTANLLLVRAASREREVAVRLAVGSSRWRLVRLLLSESMLLSIVGGVAGLLLAYWAISAVTPLMPPRSVAASAFRSVGDFSTPRLDFAVLGFTWLVMVLTALAFGLAPAVRAANAQPVDALKTGGGSSKPRRWRAFGLDAFGALIVSEIGLAVVLLVGSGLLLRSLWQLESLPLGFDTRQLVSFQIQAPVSWYRPSDAPALVERVVSGISDVPGVEAVAATFYTPFDPGARHAVRLVDAPNDRRRTGHHYVTPDYFRALGIPLLRGRSFTADDRLGRPPVAVVSEAIARQFWPGEDPVGKRFVFDRGQAAPADSVVEVIGVAGDVRYRSSDQAADPDVYTPYYQFASFVYALIIVRSSTPPARLLPALREVVATVDRDLPIDDVRTMEERGGRVLARRRLNAVLLTIFAGLALTIATVGVYGVISHLSAQRTREFGIRIALGAAAPDVLRLVLGRAVALIAAGLIVGVVGALALTRVLNSQLFDIGATDPATFIVIAGVLAGAALTASYVPARRATRVEPLTALRSE